MSDPLYKPGDPRTTDFVQKLFKISGIIDKTTYLYLTPTEWGLLLAEFRAQYSSALMFPDKPAPWDVDPRRPIQFGVKDPYLLVINSGIDDQKIVNAMNQPQAENAQFQNKKDVLRVA